MYIVAGLPASGKSTIAKKLGCNILEYDSLAYKFGSYEELNDEKELANRQFKLLVQTGIYDVVVDVFPTVKERSKILLALNCVPKIVVVLCPLKECIRRNSMRRHSMVSNDEIEGLYQTFEPISYNEGFSEIWIYNSMENIFLRRK